MADILNRSIEIEDPNNNGKKSSKKKKMFAVGCAVFASMASILTGYDIGVMSGASSFIQEDLKLSDVQLEVLLGILEIYALVGSGLAGRTSDWVGRRYTVVTAGLIFVVGSLLMGFAMNYPFLMFGRFIAGIGVGYGMMIAPVYAAEISPADSRGLLTSLPEAFINVGILLGYVSNVAFHSMPTHLGWRFMLGVAAIPSLMLSIGVLAMPESPRWLVMKGRLGDARRVLQRSSDTAEEAEHRLQMIKQAAGISEEQNDDVVQVPKLASEKGVWKELLISPTPAVRHILIAALGMHFFQQATGVDSVVLYSPTIFEKAGIKTRRNRLLATVGVGIIKTSFVLVAMFTTDRVGRRPLILTSMAGMFCTLLTLGLSLTFINRSHTAVPWAVGLSIASVLGFVSFFSTGMGPITWVYCTEIMPLRLRALGASLGVMLNRTTSGVIAMTFLSLSKAITLGGAFLLYAGLAGVALVFFYIMLPETHGKSLEETQEAFGHFRKKPKNQTDDVIATNEL